MPLNERANKSNRIQIKAFERNAQRQSAKLCMHLHRQELDLLMWTTNSGVNLCLNFVIIWKSTRTIEFSLWFKCSTLINQWSAKKKTRNHFMCSDKCDKFELYELENQPLSTVCYWKMWVKHCNHVQSNRIELVAVGSKRRCKAQCDSFRRSRDGATMLSLMTNSLSV